MYFNQIDYIINRSGSSNHARWTLSDLFILSPARIILNPLRMRMTRRDSITVDASNRLILQSLLVHTLLLEQILYFSSIDLVVIWHDLMGWQKVNRYHCCRSWAICHQEHRNQKASGGGSQFEKGIKLSCETRKLEWNPWHPRTSPPRSTTLPGSLWKNDWQKIGVFSCEPQFAAP